MKNFQIVQINPETGAVSYTGVSVWAKNLSEAQGVLKDEYPLEYERHGWKVIA